MWSTLFPELLGFQLEQAWQVPVEKINDSLRFQGIQCPVFSAETRCDGLVLWQVFNEITIVSSVGGRDGWLWLSEGGREGWSWVWIGIFGDEFLLGFGETLTIVVVLPTLTGSIRHFNRKRWTKVASENEWCWVKKELQVSGRHRQTSRIRSLFLGRLLQDKTLYAMIYLHNLHNEDLFILKR